MKYIGVRNPTHTHTDGFISAQITENKKDWVTVVVGPKESNKDLAKLYTDVNNKVYGKIKPKENLPKFVIGTKLATPKQDVTDVDQSTAPAPSPEE